MGCNLLDLRSATKLVRIGASSNRRTSRAGVPRAECSGRQTDVTESISAKVSNRRHASDSPVRNCAGKNSGSQMWDPATCGSNISREKHESRTESSLRIAWRARTQTAARPPWTRLARGNTASWSASAWSRQEPRAGSQVGPTLRRPEPAGRRHLYRAHGPQLSRAAGQQQRQSAQS